jgi:hypothetical protein
MEQLNNKIKPIITNSTELKLRIMQLKNLRAEQELSIKRNAKELYYSLQPTAIIKRTFKNLIAPKEVQNSLFNTGMNLGTSFILDKLLLRRGYGIKSFLFNSGLKKVVSILLESPKVKEFIDKFKGQSQ